MARVRGGKDGPVARAAHALLGSRGRLVIALAAAGVMLLVVSGLFGTATTPPATSTGGARPASAPKAPPKASAGAAGGASSDAVLAYESLLDHSLETVLDQVSGAGTVSVAVTVSRSPSKVLAHNLSTSRETQGARVSSSLDEALAYGSGKVPVSTAEEAGPLVGALVVAPGASDPVVRAELTQAVETLLGLGANQVIVLPGRKEGS